MVAHTKTTVELISTDDIEGFVAYGIHPSMLQQLRRSIEALGGIAEPNHLHELNLPRPAIVLQDDSTTAENVAKQSSMPSGSPCALRRISRSGLHHLDWLDLSKGDGVYCGPTQVADEDSKPNVFVLDTGIDASHKDFGHLVVVKYDCNDGTNEPWTESVDIHGHGTHVAGVIGSRRSGVTPNVILHSIKVLNDDGKGSTGSLFCGLRIIRDWLSSNPSKKAVVNLSLGSKTRLFAAEKVLSSLADDFRRQLLIVVASGNDALPACDASYATVSDVLSVGSVSEELMQSNFTNDGPCVDILAHGESVFSTYPGQRYAVFSGTSTAAPVVTGVIAQYWMDNPHLTGRELLKSVVDRPSSDLCTFGRIAGVSMGTPNKLIRYVCKSDCSALDFCMSATCLNGGVCRQSFSTVTCLCASGFRGPRCEHRDYCLAHSCQHGATCLSSSTSLHLYHCICPVGFTGNFCEHDLNECDSSPCLNDATCVDQVNKFICVCPARLQGVQCERKIPVATCSESPCLNGGTCLEALDKAMCICPTDVTGQFCEGTNEVRLESAQVGAGHRIGLQLSTTLLFLGWVAAS